MYCKSGVKQQQWELDCLLTDRTCGTGRPAHRGRASTGCNCESTTVYPRLHLLKTSKQGHRPPNTKGNLNDQLNSLDHEDLPLRHEGSVDDRDELQLRKFRSFVHGDINHEATNSMELHTCTTRTKTTMSNCNCEISMVRTTGINHCAKTEVSTTVRTATAELRDLSLTNNGHNSNLVRELHREQEELDHGELPLRHNRNVRTIRHLSLHNEVQAHLSKNSTFHSRSGLT